MGSPIGCCRRATFRWNDMTVYKSHRVKLTFPTEALILKPVIYELSRSYSVVTNIRQADITDGATTGWVILDLSGTSDEVKQALEWLSSEGVIIQLMYEFNGMFHD